LIGLTVAEGIDAWALPSISLSSASGAPGANVTMSVTLSSNSGTQPAALQWDLIYSPGDLTPAGTSFFSTGAAALAAGKLTSCGVAAPGDARCVVAGLDSTVIADGVLATVTFQISPSTTHTSSPVSFSGVEGADPRANSITMSGTGAIVSINQVTVNQLSNVSAASFQGGPLAAESIISAFGSHLAVQPMPAQSLPLPTNLGGTTVTVVDALGAARLAPLFYVSPEQVNYEMPKGTVTGAATVTVTAGDGQQALANVQIANVAPGLFYYAGTDLAAAGLVRVKSSNVQIPENDYQIDAVTKAILPRPIDLGPPTDQVYIILYGTGIRFRDQLSNVSLHLGGVTESVAYAGPQGGYAGLDQVNALIPRSLIGSGKVKLSLTVDGVTTNAVSVTTK
jgi:uncharacterized protein (TIGR03437 family)